MTTRISTQMLCRHIGKGRRSNPRLKHHCPPIGKSLRFQSSNAPRPSSSSSIFGSANDYFAALRWKAANALTSSLPEEERGQLLEKLEPSIRERPSKKEEEEQQQEEEERTVPEISIGEIVAATKAQEAQKWEQEKENLIAAAEEAARKRIESDLVIQKRQLAFEAWKQDLEREKQMNTTTTTAAAATTTVDTPKQDNELSEHPILGPVLADFGKKRIHVVSAQSLAAIPVWKKQRTYRHGRATTMAKDKLKTLHLGLPGIIGLYESSNGTLSIIDGQHRVGMLKVLQEEKDASSEFDFEKILVEVYPQPEGTGDGHAKDIFLEVNKAEPVKLVDLPGVAKASHRKIINETAQLLREHYSEMFSDSQRCRVPHLNEDNLRDALFASNVIDRHSLRSTKQLQEWIMAQNDLLSSKYKTEEATKHISANALKKAEKYDFYLGLGMDWLYN